MKNITSAGVGTEILEDDKETDADGSGTDPRIAALIDRNLKLVYSDLVQQELPDRFKDLLAVLKAQDAEAGSDDA